MHARHRNPGNGYRSNSMGMGMGMAPNSRISPETSLRGHSFYSSEHRNFNRGFGRPKSFQPPPAPPPPPPAPPRKGDIFMEAGRLAAEYLVSQGLLPPNALSAKWQNTSLKKQVGEFQEADHLQIASEGRTSALARLGNSVSDGGSRRGRFGVDEFSSNTRNHFKGKRRNGAGSYRGGYGSDWGRDYGRSGSFSDRHSRASSDREGDEGSVSGHHEEQKLSKDAGNNALQQNSSPSELRPKSEDAVDSESKLNKGQYPDDDMSSKPSSSGPWKDGPNETDEVGEEPAKVSDKEMKDQDCANNEETEKQGVSENLLMQLGAAEAEGEGDSSGKNGTDLLTLCKFAKVPTRIRSSLTHRGPKVDDPLPNTQEGTTSDAGVEHKERQALVKNGSVDVSLGTTLLDKTHYDNCLNPETSKAQSSHSAENLVESGPEYGSIEQDRYARSQSLPGRAFVNVQESTQGPVGLRSSSFVVKERGEKRVLEEHDQLEEAKKPRQWLPYMVTEADDCFGLSNLSEKKVNSLEENGSGEKLIIAVDQESSVMNESQSQKDGGEACIEFVPEKKPFQNSFKICDLNLMQVCDAHENRDTDPIIDYRANSGMKKKVAPVDVDLSMNNSNVSGENSRHTVDVKEIEVIDLENDSIQENKAFNDAERKPQTEFTPLEGFPNHAQNTSDIPDVQDGYGLMISELLGNDFPNCSSVPEDLNSMHNEIGLHNGEETLADDDAIYMALGEIPLTFLRPWEQPTPQEYEKPF
ncbi:hypothetical protein PRUPE_6G035900 [Prunus persica]|uniref:Uncharacterized protein n=1 Tax=Prunus persica TaxID=3760 RepID=A0A251NJS0_PRUPE|nr:uncharacterized protein At4g26450 isoform X1 [Prunus persica]XP_020421562.1 uncharacterized protein At4g26450 isoform X1 [Prunus persica]ONH99552.1 hypothetical protein PRUPE_6G035900 [Prunus persica]ONH99553.1 hypothetical protein PRUPE_6G035900 [Prunus persica]ONH99554.1 hypothetical protein PRUPE_6G035900 [Prunus persica]ONH99555.1 hypothetical protein PRUPE_6G035900 [Prunus persica]ONH99556.1 hypothetical protein PRUPE_6G035900 [Prunus persica]